MVLRCHFQTFRIWNGDQMRWFDAQPCEWKMPAIDIIVLIHANGKLCSRLDPSEPIAIMNALRFFWWKARTQLCAVNETPKTIDQYLHLCSCDQNAEINSIDATFQPNAQAESYDFFGLVSGFEFLLSYKLAFFIFSGCQFWRLLGFNYNTLGHWSMIIYPFDLNFVNKFPCSIFAQQ